MLVSRELWAGNEAGKWWVLTPPYTTHKNQLEMCSRLDLSPDAVKILEGYTDNEVLDISLGIDRFGFDA